MALRVSHLVDDWSEFKEKYYRVKNTSEKLFKIQLTDKEMNKDLD